jgi:hypothetical protein
VDGTLVKVMAWYDNEWGFTNQMIREAASTLRVSAAWRYLAVRPQIAAAP